MKKMKNKLDERQEQKLLQIEHNGCWFAFWALLISILVQQGMYGFSSVKEVAGEWIIFMILCIYILSGCIRNGIWDRHLSASPKTNFIVSLIASVLFGILMGVMSYFNFHSIEAALATMVIIAITTFILCFLFLSLTARMYKKRVKQLEEDDME